MKIITAISNSFDIGFFRLKTSCALMGLNLIAVKCEQNSYISHNIKDELFQKYLHELDDNEIVLFTDGYDSLLLADQGEILKKFYQKKTDLVFSAETCCYPDMSLRDKYPKIDKSPYKYLNSGGFMGKVGLLKKIYSKRLSCANQEFDWSNQYLWTLRYLQNTERIKLDSNCEIFCTFSPEITYDTLSIELKNDSKAYASHFYEWFNTNFRIKGGRIFNRITGTWPCNVHFNGRSSCFFDSNLDGWEILYQQIPGSKNCSVIEFDKTNENLDTRF